jgi:hypothetical protein
MDSFFMDKMIVKYLLLVCVIAFCTSSLQGRENANDNPEMGQESRATPFSQNYLPLSVYPLKIEVYYFSSEESSSGSSEETTDNSRGMKRSYSSMVSKSDLYPSYWCPLSGVIPPAKHPLSIEDIFDKVSGCLNFKDYIAGFSSSCTIFRHWAIKKIVRFSDHYEFPEKLNRYTKGVLLNNSEKWICIPRDYKDTISMNKFFLMAFVSLEALDLCGQGWDEKCMGDYFIKEENDFDTHENERLYLIQGDDLRCFSNLQTLNIIDNRAIQGGSWASDLTSLTALSMSVVSSSEDIQPCIDCALESFPNLKELNIECAHLLNYESVLGLTNLTRLSINMDRLYDEYGSVDVYGPCRNIIEDKIWNELPKLELYTYGSQLGSTVSHTREQFMKIKETEKKYIKDYKRDHPTYSWACLNKALEEFRKNERADTVILD